MKQRFAVALDGRTLQETPIGGIGRALANLLPHLADHVDITVLTDGRRPAPPAPPGVVPLRAPLSRRGAAWLQLAAPRYLRDFKGMFHCPFYGLPYRQSVPMVVTMHDLTFETRPEWFSASRRLAFRLQARHAANSAGRIFTDSEHVRDEILDRYRVPAERVLVVPLTVDDHFRDMPSPERQRTTQDRLGVRPPFLVALGGAPRRNLRRAVETWREVRRSHPELALVVVGRERVPPAPGLFDAGPVGDDDWSALLAGSAAFLYPTEYEGFGLPALEAIASGTIVVCGRVGALPEVLGAAAAWSDSTTVDGLATSVLAVLNHEELAATLRQLGLSRVAQAPTWATIASETVQGYREALDG
jgi:glycosyltransferase involved in cell wall biosynthesis